MNSSPAVTRSATQKSKIQTRAMKASTDSNRPQQQPHSRPNSALQEAKRKAKLKMIETCEEQPIKDVFQNAMDAKDIIRSSTGVVYDNSMYLHKCLWSPHPECPERYLQIMARCKEMGLIERCENIKPRYATKDEILLKHSEEHYNKLKAISEINDKDRLENISSKYDSIYFNQNTFNLSLLAVGSSIELINNIVNGKVQNGMAIIRPPGHHAMQNEFNGYCFFNNVAIAAQYALDKLDLKKILIVDWDVHHGQATQRFFYNDPRVLYFSIHRFEFGTFWPNLQESNFDAVGRGAGTGYNFNLPLNETAMKNGDYLAIFQQILIPVALEFQPELVIVSAGYDAALGCPEGEMELSPAFYAHLVNSLSCLAQSRLAVILEGGYCLDSLAEGAALTLRALLGDPCPVLVEPIRPPCESIQDSILNCIYSHRAYWKCLQTQLTYTLVELNNINPQPDLHKVNNNFQGGPPLPKIFPTRFPPLEIKENYKAQLRNLKLATNLTFPKIRLCYVYDEQMMKHENLYEKNHPEHPDRIKMIKKMHKEYKLFYRMTKLESRHATKEEICLVHTREHVDIISASSHGDLLQLSQLYNSVYLHLKTFASATLAVGCVLQVVDNVLNGYCRSGVCIVRPPGHHAEADVPHGFCIFNNVAIAAEYAVRNHGLKRVLIVDWDVHHGNGTQHIFEKSKNVLYISVHRYDHGSFFPKSTDANFNVVGSEDGEGFNVNIPWNKKGMGDFEYSMVFQQIILPIAYEFDPEIVLVSAGFDAAVGDPLGGCKVTPEAYGYFTHWLSGLANGKIIVCLEGGYNVNSISYAMTMCSKALLGDPLPMLQIDNQTSSKSMAQLSCAETIRNVVDVQQKYWQSLKFGKKLPEVAMKVEYLNLISSFDNMKVKQCADDNKEIQQQKSQQNDSNQPGPSASRQQQHQTVTDFILENFQALQNEEMFAVVPLKTCPHLSTLNPDAAPSAFNIKDVCSQCKSENENWICLNCFTVNCGRYVNEDALIHHHTTNHPLALSFSDLSVWCYVCESYIDNPILFKYKNLAHKDKFGEELVWSYGNQTVPQ